MAIGRCSFEDAVTRSPNALRRHKSKSTPRRYYARTASPLAASIRIAYLPGVELNPRGNVPSVVGKHAAPPDVRLTLRRCAFSSARFGEGS